MDVGQNAFSWRLPGVLAGALMAGLLFLLARILFRRRSVAVLAGLFVLADGMLFAQSRIAMNDAYVALFIVAAVTLFAAIWTGAWRWRGAFWVGLPVVGLLLGLALASKWVALYAIGGIGLLILLRSALGRALIVLGLGAIAATLGYMAISTGPEATTGGNLLFLLLMVALTLVASAVAVLHPVAWTVEEIRIAVGGPAAAGAALGLASVPLGLGPLAQAAAVGLMALGGAAAGGFWLAGRMGLGPLAPPPAPDDPAALLEPAEPAPPGWLRPGWLAGLPIAWAAVCLVAIPVAVYVASYLPWAALGNQIVTGWPAGHDGQTLLDLTRGMYDYHNNLRATHAASSPWWAWPANLKPVWFYQEGFAGGTAAAIYDAGNLATWWLSIPALAFAAWQAFRRRSLALALVGIMFASLWLPWARIDRATFQYHYYTALPFVAPRPGLLRGRGLARSVAPDVAPRPGRGRGRRAGAGGAVALPRAALRPHRRGAGQPGLPGLHAGGVAADRPHGAGRRPHRRHRRRRDRPRLAAPRRGPGDASRGGTGPDAPGRRPDLAHPGGRGGGPRRRRRSSCPRRRSSRPGASPASSSPWSSSRSSGPSPGSSCTRPRRGASRSASSWRPAFVFVLFYPNVSGLPLPNGVYNWYQGLLPTWLYPFQFPVNTDPAVGVQLLGPWAAAPLRRRDAGGGLRGLLRVGLATGARGAIGGGRRGRPGHGRALSVSPGAAGPRAPRRRSGPGAPPAPRGGG